MSLSKDEQAKDQTFFDGMSKKDKRNFQKLPIEKQREVISGAIMQKISTVMTREIAKATIAGMDNVIETLYNEHVSLIDVCQDPEERDNLIDKLLGYIRKEYLRIQVNRKNQEVKPE